VNAYGDAGATIVFIETPRSEAEVETLAKAIRFPLQTVSMAGVGMPTMSRKRLSELGFSFVMHPADLAQVALKAMEDVLGTISRDDLPADFADRSFNFHQITGLVHTAEYLDLEKNTPERSAMNNLDTPPRDRSESVVDFVITKICEGIRADTSLQATPASGRTRQSARHQPASFARGAQQIGRRRVVLLEQNHGASIRRLRREDILEIYESAK